MAERYPIRLGNYDNQEDQTNYRRSRFSPQRSGEDTAFDLGAYIKQIEATPAPSPTAKQTKLGALGSAAMQGLGGAAADVYIGASDIGTNIYNMFGDDSTDIKPQDAPIASGARIFKERLREEHFPVDPKHEGFGTDVARGVGQFGSMLIGGAAVGGGKIGAALVGSGLGGLQRVSEIGEDYDEAVKENKIEYNELDRFVAQSIGAGTTVATQYVPIFNALNRIDKVTGGAVGHVAKSVGKGTLEEGLQEMSEKVVDDLVAKKLIAFDPKRNLFYETPDAAKELGYEGAVGGTVGGLINLLTSSLGMRKAGRIERGLRAKAEEAQNQALNQARATDDENFDKNPITKKEFTDPKLKNTWKGLRDTFNTFNRMQGDGRVNTEPAFFKSIAETLDKQLNKLASKHYINGEVSKETSDEVEAIFRTIYGQPGVDKIKSLKLDAIKLKEQEVNNKRKQTKKKAEEKKAKAEEAKAAKEEKAKKASEGTEAPKKAEEVVPPKSEEKEAPEASEEVSEPKTVVMTADGPTEVEKTEDGEVTTEFTATHLSSSNEPLQKVTETDDDTISEENKKHLYLDAEGNEVIDPTAEVIDLAAITPEDDVATQDEDVLPPEPVGFFTPEPTVDEDLAKKLGKSLMPDGNIGTNKGKPYRKEAQANAQLKAKVKQEKIKEGEYEVIPVEGGFVLSPVKVAPEPTVEPTPEEVDAGEAQAEVDAYKEVEPEPEVTPEPIVEDTTEQEATTRNEIETILFDLQERGFSEKQVNLYEERYKKNNQLSDPKARLDALNEQLEKLQSIKDSHETITSEATTEVTPPPQTEAPSTIAEKIAAMRAKETTEEVAPEETGLPEGAIGRSSDNTPYTLERVAKAQLKRKKVNGKSIANTHRVQKIGEKQFVLVPKETTEEGATTSTKSERLRDLVVDEKDFQYRKKNNSCPSKEFDEDREYNTVDGFTLDEIYAIGIQAVTAFRKGLPLDKYTKLLKQLISVNPELQALGQYEEYLVSEILQGIGSGFNVEDMHFYIEALSKDIAPYEELSNNETFNLLIDKIETATGKTIEWVPTLGTLTRIVDRIEAKAVSKKKTPSKKKEKEVELDQNLLLMPVEGKIVAHNIQALGDRFTRMLKSGASKIPKVQDLARRLQTFLNATEQREDPLDLWNTNVGRELYRDLVRNVTGKEVDPKFDIPVDTSKSSKEKKKQSKGDKLLKGSIVHAPRNTEDIPSILEQGLKAGTNVGKGAKNQAIATEPVVLVYDENDVDLRTKDYRSSEGIINAQKPAKPTKILINTTDLGGSDIGALDVEQQRVIDFFDENRQAIEEAYENVELKKGKSIEDQFLTDVVVEWTILYERMERDLQDYLKTERAKATKDLESKFISKVWQKKVKELSRRIVESERKATAGIVSRTNEEIIQGYLDKLPTDIPIYSITVDEDSEIDSVKLIRDVVKPIEEETEIIPPTDVEVKVEANENAENISRLKDEIAELEAAIEDGQADIFYKGSDEHIEHRNLLSGKRKALKNLEGTVSSEIKKKVNSRSDEEALGITRSFDSTLDEDQDIEESRVSSTVPIRMQTASYEEQSGVVDKFQKSMSKASTSDLVVVFAKSPEDIPNAGLRKYYRDLLAKGKKLPGGFHASDVVIDWKLRKKNLTVVFYNPDLRKVDIERVLFHEVVGHYGFRKIFKNDYNVFLSQALNNRAYASEAFNNRKVWTGIDPFQITGPTMKVRDLDTGRMHDVDIGQMQRLMDETIAREAERWHDPAHRKANLKYTGMMNRLFAWIKHLLRKSSFGSFIAPVSKQELYSLIAESNFMVFKPEKQLSKTAKKLASMVTPSESLTGDARRKLQQKLLKDEKGWFDEKLKWINRHPWVDQPITQEEIDIQLSPERMIQESRSAAIEAGIDPDYVQRVSELTSSNIGIVNNNWWQRNVTKIADAIRRSKHLSWASSLGNIPMPKVFNKLEGELKGIIGNAQRKGRVYSKMVAKLNKEQNVALYEYFTTKDADEALLPVDKPLRDLSKELKETIMKMGDILHKYGRIPTESWEANRSAYLPMRYWKYLNTYMGAGKKLSFQNYLKERDPNLTDEQKNELGVIKDTGILVPETVAVLSRDVALHDFFVTLKEYDKKNKYGWFLGNSAYVIYNGKKTRLNVIQQEIHNLHQVIALGQEKPLYQEEEAVETNRQRLAELEALWEQGKQQVRQDVANLLETRGVKATPEIVEQFMTDEYKFITNPAFGELQWTWIHKSIYDDLVESFDDFSTERNDIMAKAFGPGGKVEKYHQMWKANKVILNPPSWMRNAVGNFVLLDIGTSTNMVSLGNMLVQEIKQHLVDGNPSEWMQLARDKGLWDNTYSMSELYLLHKGQEGELKKHIRLQEANAGQASMWKMFYSGLGGYNKIFEKASQIYGGMEGVFKTVAMRDHIQKWLKENGLKSLNDIQDQATRDVVINEAVHQANKTIFDYSKVPAWLRSARRMPFVGAPFLTFTYKSIPATIDAMARRPHKVIKYMMLPYLLSQITMAAFDWDDDDMDEIKRSMPMWMQEQSSVFIMPWKDANGKLQGVPFGYYLPWSAGVDWGLLMHRQYDHTDKIGSTLGSAKDVVLDMGFMGGPVPTVMSALISGQDPFTEQDIYKPGGTAYENYSNMSRFLYTMWMPTWLTSYGVLGKLIDQTGMEIPPFSTGQAINRYGTDKETLSQTLLRGGGLNVYGFDPQESKASNIKYFQKQRRDIIKARTMTARNRNLSGEERASRMLEYTEKIKRLNARQRKFTTGQE